MKPATMQRAAAFGARFLQTAGEASAYSRQQKNDLDLAIAMLRAAPDLIRYAPVLCGAAEAGDGSDETQATLMRAAAKLRAAIERATDRSEGEKI